jgi:predicted CXXCH cytochrome family protein
MRDPLRLLIPALTALLCMATTTFAQFDEEEPTPLYRPPTTCTTAECHTDILSKKVIHGIAKQDCSACHVQGNPDEHRFYLLLPEKQLCVKCHAIPHQHSNHAPVVDRDCMKCHDAHSSDHRKLLTADPRRDLCTQCHQDDYSHHDYVHGPIVTGACIVCHNAHGSERPRLLAEEPNTLCLSCHTEVSIEPGPDRHIHAALEEGCTKCHDPHASKHRFQLRDKAPGLCLSCHQDQMSNAMHGSKHVHAAINQEGGCTACHEPHASRLPSLQKGDQTNVCLSCHNEHLTQPSSTTPSSLTNMALLLANNPTHHGPIRQGACTECHDPHGGDNFRLLLEPYPAPFYAPFKQETFALCFKCHIPDLVQKESARGLTNFRDGDRNLHYLHVNQEKGRTCRACHEVHASSRPFHIRESVPFGETGWMLEINFKASEHGGSCAPACHKPKEYTRGDNRPAPITRPAPVLRSERTQR